LDGILSQDDLAGMLYDSLNKKIKTLPDGVIVYPAHGPGSACGKNIGKETHSTIGEQKKFNYALKAMSRVEFIKEVTEDILPPPAYFFEDARINKTGYEPIDEVMLENKRPLSVAEFGKAMKEGAMILDTRQPDEFEQGFIPGSLNIGLNGQYAVWVGTLLDMKRPLVLVADPGKEEESVLRLARIGYENVIGYLEGGVHAWRSPLETVTSITAEQMKEEIEKGVAILDVRKPGEWAFSHLKNAQFVPLTGMPDNLKSLDKDKQYIVHCGGGYRSMIAISLMKRQGFNHLINIYGGFGAMQHAGLELITEEESVIGNQ
jgi:rhodanese-related sulfurtransferase